MSDNGKHPLMHTPRKFPSILGHRVYDHMWRVSFLDRFGVLIFGFDPYILHGPDPRDNGFAEILAMASKTRKENPTQPIHSVKIKYLGVV